MFCFQSYHVSSLGEAIFPSDLEILGDLTLPCIFVPWSLRFTVLTELGQPFAFAKVRAQERAYLSTDCHGTTQETHVRVHFKQRAIEEDEELGPGLKDGTAPKLCPGHLPAVPGETSVEAA